MRIVRIKKAYLQQKVERIKKAYLQKSMMGAESDSNILCVCKGPLKVIKNANNSKSKILEIRLFNPDPSI